MSRTVNVQEASFSSAFGAPYPAGCWKDPQFDPKQRAFYDVRAPEVPTSRSTL